MQNLRNNNNKKMNKGNKGTKENKKRQAEKQTLKYMEPTGGCQRGGGCPGMGEQVMGMQRALIFMSTE